MGKGILLGLYLTDLLSTKEPQKMEVALSTAESLIRSEPHDLSEVHRHLFQAPPLSMVLYTTLYLMAISDILGIR